MIIIIRSYAFALCTHVGSKRVHLEPPLADLVRERAAAIE